jgi:hypothetical protein
MTHLTVIEGGARTTVSPRHHYRTHAYFRVVTTAGSGFSVDDLAELMGLRCEPTMAPFPGALYFGDEERVHVFVPAVVVRYRLGEITFAVDYNYTHYLSVASTFAQLVPPVLRADV